MNQLDTLILWSKFSVNVVKELKCEKHRFSGSVEPRFGTSGLRHVCDSFKKELVAQYMRKDSCSSIEHFNERLMFMYSAKSPGVQKM